jgi:hypothetical protein
MKSNQFTFCSTVTALNVRLLLFRNRMSVEQYFRDEKKYKLILQVFVADGAFF